LGKALGREAADELQMLSEDPDDKVKVAAARALADLGDRRSLAALVGLLSAEDVAVRVASALTLKAVTQQDFAYAAYDAADKREAAIDRWKSWLAGDGRTAKLNFPLKPLFAGDGYLKGNMLLAFGFSNRVAEYDPSGREIWSFYAPGAWSAEKMRNGNVLIARHNGPVIQVDPAKNIVWQYDCTTPLNAKALDSGNILIAESGANRVIEVSPDKKVVWTYACSGAPTDVHRLDNGNTLVAIDRAGCFEVTPEGKTVWEYTTGINLLYGCQPLPGGNVLLADLGGKVREVTRDKQVVWEYEFGACDCFRLPNGNTLITGHLNFLEVTPDKKLLWNIDTYGYGSARR
jgi:outer membrane protein assembly factor BamB